MTSDPATLSRLSRDELIEHARSIGIAQPEPLTRAELQDEIVRRSEQDERRRKILRGWFGVARDLVASLVDQGLHLPDAAAIIRGSEPPDGEARNPVATVTLAEIFAQQGHRKKALRILADVLEVEPEHEVARRLHERLLQDEAASSTPSSGRLPPTPADTVPDPAPDDTPSGRFSPAPADVMPDPVPSGEVSGDVDVLSPGEEVIPVDRDAAFTRVTGEEVGVYWQLEAAGIERVQQRWPGARPVIQLVVVAPSLGEPRRDLLEIAIEEPLGSVAVPGVPAGAAVRAAVGWRHDAQFTPVVVAAELGADGSLGWRPWGHVLSATAQSRAASLLRD